MNEEAFFGLANVKPRKDTVNTAAKAVAFTILEYSKEHMIDIHYNVIKKHFGEGNVRLLMTDTDSLIYEFKCSHDIMRELVNMPNHFDVSGSLERLAHAQECSEDLLRRVKANKGCVGLAEGRGRRRHHSRVCRSLLRDVLVHLSGPGRCGDRCPEGERRSCLSVEEEYHLRSLQADGKRAIRVDRHFPKHDVERSRGAGEERSTEDAELLQRQDLQGLCNRVAPPRALAEHRLIQRQSGLINFRS